MATEIVLVKSNTAHKTGRIITCQSYEFFYAPLDPLSAGDRDLKRTPSNAEQFLENWFFLHDTPCLELLPRVYAQVRQTMTFLHNNVQNFLWSIYRKVIF